MDHKLPADEITNLWKEVAQERERFQFVPNDAGKTRKRPESIVIDVPDGPAPEPLPKAETDTELDSTAFHAKAAEATSLLQDGLDAFARDFGTPNLWLIEARKEVGELEAKLREAKARLASIEAEGDSLDRFTSAISSAENALFGLQNMARTLIGNQLQVKAYGHVLPREKRDEGARSLLKLHKRIVDLDKLSFFRLSDLSPSLGKDKLEQRASNSMRP
jgi:hypothetical protein